MIKILFICHGNICRSPMAEFCLKDLLAKANASSLAYISSAATSAEELGNPVYPPAKRKLREQGIDCAGKTARQITRSDYEKYDIIVAMEHYNLRNTERITGPDRDRKFRLLMDYTDTPGGVADPWYTGDFDEAWRDIEKGCRAMAERIIGGKKL
ncbi:MAG: low molecular weight phosphotyrosine protein phosphatase [Clostridia bacterium]|nr:low molecular weight phosphotyrosine protein phosphatase [Clostridia bacterium]